MNDTEWQDRVIYRRLISEILVEPAKVSFASVTRALVSSVDSVLGEPCGVRVEFLEWASNGIRSISDRFRRNLWRIGTWKMCIFRGFFEKPKDNSAKIHFPFREISQWLLEPNFPTHLFLKTLSLNEKRNGKVRVSSNFELSTRARC